MTTTKPKLGWGLALGAGLALALGAALWSQSKAPDSAGPGSAGFTLIDPAGKPFTQANLGGKPYAIYFGYTRCPDICPTSLARMARLRLKLGAAGDKFAIVFVSVDPERDKPEMIGRYANMFGTPIFGLTGTPAQLETVEKAYGVYVRKVPLPGSDYSIDHTAAVYLLGADGHFVDMIDHNDTDEVALEKLKKLIG